MYGQYEKLGELGEHLIEYSTSQLPNVPINQPEQMCDALEWSCRKSGCRLPYCAKLAADFLPIQGDKSLHYGGDQSWFADDFHCKAGCGAVAVACITAYLGLHDGKESLYAGENEGNKLTIPGFLPHMDAVINMLTPTSFGIPWVPYLQRGAERYIRSRGMDIEKWYTLHGRRRCERRMQEAEAYLLFNLMNNRPVACIHWGGVKALPVLNPHEVPEGNIVDMNWHWVIITGMERRNSECTVTVSSCGSKYIFPLCAFLGGGPSMVSPVVRNEF